jgi:hypothetical protein
MYEQFMRVADGVVVMAVWYHHGDKTIEYISGINPMEFREIEGGDDTHRVSFIPSHDNVYVGVGAHEFYRSPGLFPENPELNYQTANIPTLVRYYYRCRGIDNLSIQCLVGNKWMGHQRES